MKNKRIMSAAMAVLMAGSLAACGGSASSTADSTAAESTSTAASTEATAESTDEPVTIRITWWGGQTRHDLTQQVLDLYTSEHPNVTFEAVPSGWDGYFEKLATDTATGGMPDIVQMDYMYISTYAQNGSLADLSEYINNGTIDASGIDEALMNASNIGGKTVGIPLSTSLVAFTYNPSVLEEAGVDVPTDDWTWDDFATAAKTVKEKTGKYGMSTSPVIDTNMFNYWVRGYGEKLFADDNKSLGYDDDKITEDFFTYWLDLIDAGAVPNPDEYEQIATLGNDANPVITNDAAFHQSWNNFTTIGANAGNDTLKLVAPPTNTTNTKALWYKPGMFFSVAETSSVKKEAAEFINWFLNSDEANDIMMGERGTPASATAREHLINSGKLSAQQTDMFNFVDTAAAYCGDTPAADPAGISEINTIFKNIGYAVFYGQTTPADAAAQFHTEVNAVLEANN